MCGITGWVDWKDDLSQRTDEIKEMAFTLAKRGPDALNVWCDTHVAFGHTRLSVVDPEGGSQPMSKTQGNTDFHIIYNGELYNTEELRKELLGMGYTFRSHSDTEVLLTSYMAWGESCLQKLNGIFAFAVWNAREKHLFAARDRLGVKPFFYYQQGDLFLFASELKAILKHPRVRAVIDRHGLAEVFGLGPSRTPGSGVFKGIQELRPAHYLQLKPQRLCIERYWQVESKPHEDSLEETVEHVRWLLQDTVRRQLVADVPICTFLSGGVDSSAITAIAADALRGDHEPLRTFSIDYAENDRYFQASDYQPNTDQPYIQLVRDAVGTNHDAKVIDTETLVHLLEDAVLARDLPGMADIDSSLLWFCKEIKKMSTVALSGECADEIFGGYPWFYREELMQMDGFPWMRSIAEREQLLRREIREKVELQTYIREAYQRTVDETPRLEGESAFAARRRELFYLNMIWFMTTLLDRKDRMSMAASLEVRVPFADHRLVQYVWNIPWEMKMADGREKGILRKALEGVLPQDVLYRKKSPYPKTHHPQYARAVQQQLLRLLEDDRAPLWEVLDRQQVRRIAETEGKSFSRPWFGQLMTGPQLMAHLCQIDIWLRAYRIDLEL